MSTDEASYYLRKILARPADDPRTWTLLMGAMRHALAGEWDAAEGALRRAYRHLNAEAPRLESPGYRLATGTHPCQQTPVTEAVVE